jgi:aminodeoxyfutalosine deaminase
MQTKNEHFEITPGGILCPGFINTHCHLELSHLKGKVSEGKGMTGFISELVPQRSKFTNPEIQEAIKFWDAEMYKNGIVAVGDICNTDDTFSAKAQSKIYYHSFIELFDLNPARTQEVMDQGKMLAGLLRKDQPYSFVPHAPYTVTPGLYKLIAENQPSPDVPVCIHNQESLAESEAFESNSGAIWEMFKKLGIDMGWLKRTGLNSLRSYYENLLTYERIQLVHNTYTSGEDVAWAMLRREEGGRKREKPFDVTQGGLRTEDCELFFCTCPNANLYIEGRLPDYPALLKAGAKMTIGTDSLASNHQLSILEEMKTIQKHFDIPTTELIRWATINGAEFLGIDKQFGSFGEGKTPGVNLIKGIDPVTLKLLPHATVERVS